MELTRSDTHKSLNVSICLSESIGSRLGFGPMLVDAFSQTGCRVDCVDDGVLEALQADILLLAGNCSHFVKFPKLLSRHKGPRPKTILWQLEPLAPPGMTEHAERLGLKVAICDRKKLPRVCLKLVKATVPAHRKLERFIRKILTENFKKEMANQGGQNCGDITAQELFFVMDQHRWLKRQFSQCWCDFVFASTVPRCQLLNSIGIPAKYVPAGYHRGWGRKLAANRNIDVLFIGNVNRTSRTNLLESIHRNLASKGIELVTAAPDCYGQQRTELLNRARIVLDIMRIPWEMPVMRLLMSMGCGAMVVSNWTGEPTPFTEEHFVRASADELPQVIAHYLEHEDERQAIADSAHRFVTQELTLLNSVSQIMTESNINCAIPAITGRTST